MVNINAAELVVLVMGYRYRYFYEQTPGKEMPLRYGFAVSTFDLQPCPLIINAK